MNIKEPTLDELKVLHDRFKQYYNDGGLISIESDYIQVKSSLFKKLCKDCEVKLEWNGNSIHLEATKDGLRFITLV